MMQRIRWFLVVLGIIVLLVLGLANQTSVPVKMPLIFEVELPLSMLLVTTSGISFVFGALMTGWMLRGRSESKKAAPKPKAADSTTPATTDKNPLL